MNSYVVRVYRAGRGKRRLLVGIVEEVGREDKRAFASMDELWEILNSAGRNSSGQRKSRRETAPASTGSEQCN